jgi:hypothetical protein
MAIMKKFLYIVSYLLFGIAAIKAIMAVIASVGGVLLLCASPFSDKALTLASYCGIGYLHSMVAILIVCVIFNLYKFIEKVVRRHE